MGYIKYLSYMIYGFIISSTIFLVLVLWQVGSPTESSRWSYEIYQIKSEIAESLDSPKIVIVSGSNSLFGISCKMIYDETGFNCVNGGTHAGLGTHYILEASKKWLNSEDMVILPLEYSSYYDDGKFSDLLIDYVLSRDFDYFKSANIVDQISIISGVSFERLSKGIGNKFFFKDKPWQSFYNSKNLNEYGDETSNLVSNITAKNQHKLDNIKPMKSQGQINHSKGMKFIADYVKFCRQNDIKILATWPNTIWFDTYKNTKQSEWKAIKNFYKKLNVDILGNPEDFMYDKSMFYDSSYHLNNIGVEKRTRKLIQLLNPYLKLF